MPQKLKKKKTKFKQKQTTPNHEDQRAFHLKEQMQAQKAKKDLNQHDLQFPKTDSMDMLGVQGWTQATHFLTKNYQNSKKFANDNQFIPHIVKKDRSATFQTIKNRQKINHKRKYCNSRKQPINIITVEPNGIEHKPKQSILEKISKKLQQKIRIKSSPSDKRNFSVVNNLYERLQEESLNYREELGLGLVLFPYNSKAIDTGFNQKQHCNKKLIWMRNRFQDIKKNSKIRIRYDPVHKQSIEQKIYLEEWMKKSPMKIQKL